MSFFEIYRADFELIVPIFHNRITFDEDLLENAFIRDSLRNPL